MVYLKYAKREILSVLTHTHKVTLRGNGCVILIVAFISPYIHILNHHIVQIIKTLLKNLNICSFYLTIFPHWSWWWVGVKGGTARSCTASKRRQGDLKDSEHIRWHSALLVPLPPAWPSCTLLALLSLICQIPQIFFPNTNYQKKGPFWSNSFI